MIPVWLHLVLIHEIIQIKPAGFIFVFGSDPAIVPTFSVCSDYSEKRLVILLTLAHSCTMRHSYDKESLHPCAQTLYRDIVLPCQNA